MKYRGTQKEYRSLDLQLFAVRNRDSDGGNAGGDDQDRADDSDKDREAGFEKKYSEKEMTEAVKRRLARERRKWQKNQDAAEKQGKDSVNAGDEYLELEQAIRKVVKKYPQFKKGSSDSRNEDDTLHNSCIYNFKLYF